ncbi:hypothetical protein IV38_GL000954 [Lactobacillus selangorensis]|uniref:Probable membrane transporter protein n=1 Tax=Lactobacillus selangorensis TaxID=81857 RepID=A0A0R2FV63_9LACO|nr:sulfite exporter TauE/SafE family protein [Lactobacillus selangorensis]KRN28749.1 hypothetical protein IV38_GL000954 [Lactobacillus selangorensis]KRN32841.1 hypothetical protein IV40_GL000899 [Lactobacillus selangorensis]
MTLFIIIIANIIIGALVGMTGVAGFLLPILYTSLVFPVNAGLAFSFAAFVVSGTLGTYNYHKLRLLDFPLACKLGIGSFIGAILGVRLNLLLSSATIKTILYWVVLLSGISILIKTRQTTSSNHKQQHQLQKNSFLFVLGAITGLICALSGAGGPILVMPLLLLFDCEPHLAVGVALLDSVFISLPAAVGYLSQINLNNYLLLFILILVSHGIGVYGGSRYGNRLNGTYLKIGVALFSIGIAALHLFL